MRDASYRSSNARFRKQPLSECDHLWLLCYDGQMGYVVTTIHGQALLEWYYETARCNVIEDQTGASERDALTSNRSVDCETDRIKPNRMLKNALAMG